MKNKTKILLLSSSLLTCCLTSCVGGSVNNDEEDTKNLKIMILNRGYGTTWLKKIAENFKSKNEGVEEIGRAHV